MLDDILLQDLGNCYNYYISTKFTSFDPHYMVYPLYAECSGHYGPTPSHHHQILNQQRSWCLMNTMWKNNHNTCNIDERPTTVLNYDMNNSLWCNEVSKFPYTPVRGRALKKHGHHHALGSKLSTVYHAIGEFCADSGSLLWQQCSTAFRQVKDHSLNRLYNSLSVHMWIWKLFIGTSLSKPHVARNTPNFLQCVNQQINQPMKRWTSESERVAWSPETTSFGLSQWAMKTQTEQNNN